VIACLGESKTSGLDSAKTKFIALYQAATQCAPGMGSN
jgi:hypothetical protein